MSNVIDAPMGPHRPAFDEHAERHDGWYLANPIVLQSQLLLVKAALGTSPGRTLSVGCGSGLFEWLLRRDHGITIDEAVEPSNAMAAVARMRGLNVHLGAAESLPMGAETFDTVLLNGTASYLARLEQALIDAHRVLRSDGFIVMADVPRESAYALIHELALCRGGWTHASFLGVAPRSPYPLDQTTPVHWRTTPEKAKILEATGFVGLHFLQTLTRHPVYANDSVEEPSLGYDRGGYVAIIAKKPRRAA